MGDFDRQIITYIAYDSLARTDDLTFLKKRHRNTLKPTWRDISGCNFDIAVFTGFGKSLKVSVILIVSVTVDYP
jgi:hypothetical protein